MTVIPRSNFAVLVLLFQLFPLGDVAYAKDKPEIVRLDAEYLETLVKINVHWQSPNPVTIIRAIVGKEQKELKVDEYDNRRNPAGYTGEAVIVVNAVPTAGRDGIPYVVQIEDDLRQKSEQVTGSVNVPEKVAGIKVLPYPGGAGAGTGAWSASGAWSATGTGPPLGSWPAGGTTGQGSGGKPPGGGGAVRGAPPTGDPWAKAQQGMPGELIDRTIGQLDPKGKAPKGSPGADRTMPATGSGPATGTAGLSKTLQNENFTPGGRVSFVSGLNPDDEVAVILGPVDRPFKVTKISFLLGGSTGKGILTLKIYGDPGGTSSGTVLFAGSFEIQGSDTVLRAVDLAQLGGVVTVPEGSIRVSIQVQHTGLPGIGYDMGANAVPGRNWINRSGAWSDFGVDGIPGNGIIRATVAP